MNCLLIFRGLRLSVFSVFEQKQTVNSVFTHGGGLRLSVFSVFEQKQTVDSDFAHGGGG